MDERKRTRSNEQNQHGREGQSNRAIRTSGAKRSVSSQAAKQVPHRSPQARTDSVRRTPARKAGSKKSAWNLLKILIPVGFFFWLIFIFTGHFGQPKEEQVWEMIQQGAVVFSDGQAVDQWKLHEGDLPENVSYYKLSDGTVLFIEYDPEIRLEGQTAFTSLGDAARQTIMDYYNSRGKLYDLTALLQQAYTLYQASPENYTPAQVEQVVTLSASNARILCCLTSVVQTGNAGQQQQRYGEVFRRETGEKVDLWSMFSVSEAQARSSLVHPADPALQGTLAELLRPEWVVFCLDNIEINIPAGTFALQESSYQLGIRYEDLAGLLYSWAIPDSVQ